MDSAGDSDIDPGLLSDNGLAADCDGNRDINVLRLGLGIDFSDGLHGRDVDLLGVRAGHPDGLAVLNGLVGGLGLGDCLVHLSLNMLGRLESGVDVDRGLSLGHNGARGSVDDRLSVPINNLGLSHWTQASYCGVVNFVSGLGHVRKLLSLVDLGRNLGDDRGELGGGDGVSVSFLSDGLGLPNCQQCARRLLELF